MKNLALVMAALCLCVLFGCSNETISENSNFEKRKVKVETPPLPDPSESDTGEHCFYTHLIAGQHYVAGSVTADVVGDNLIITFSATGDWTIGTTHLSIGNCDEDWVPLNGAGNPQIGHFEYTEPFSSTPQEVVYVIPLEGLNDNYCFAAHAEVQGPSGGETAWAQGAEFGGNSWAMFVESFLSNCDSNDDDGGDNGPT